MKFKAKKTDIINLEPSVNTHWVELLYRISWSPPRALYSVAISMSIPQTRFYSPSSIGNCNEITVRATNQILGRKIVKMTESTGNDILLSRSSFSDLSRLTRVA